MAESVSRWQAAMPLDELRARCMADVMVGRQLVLLIWHGGKVRAVQGLCPHAFTRLVKGRVTEDGWLACPAHAAIFDLKDGSCGPGWVLPALQRYPSQILDGMVMLPDPLQPVNCGDPT